MGRPPCCDKVGIKKGPWTPEEDIILVSYIQEHGPGNWRSVPTNTGLLRCSKSCRLRWTNYLRPGIKRGNFTPHEEGMIIHLQALLGNKWAAIASYLPQRTDNDIKNYWNTHLKKKLKKFQSTLDPHSNNIPISDQPVNNNNIITAHHQFLSNRTTDHHITSHSGISSDHHNPHNLSTTLKNSTSSSDNSSSTYASSTENISRLLEGWMRSSPKTTTPPPNNNAIGLANIACHDHEVAQKKSVSAEKEGGRELVTVHDEFESILSFDENINNNNNNVSSWERSSTCSESTPLKGNSSAGLEDHDHEIKVHHVNVNIGKNYSKQRSEHSSGTPPLSFLEKWLLDETSISATAGQVEEMMELSPMF